MRMYEGDGHAYNRVTEEGDGMADQREPAKDCGA